MKKTFDAYLRNVIQCKNQSQSTEEQHILAYKSLRKFLGRDIALEELTFEEVRKWKNFLETNHRSIQTVYNRLVRLRCVLRYAEKQGWECLSHEDVLLPKRCRHRAPNYLREAEISRLIDVAAQTRGKMRSKRNAAMVALMYSSGIRVGEVIRMNRADVQTDYFTAHGKGQKDRVCFIDARARYYINEYLKCRTDFNDALFVSDVHKERLSISTVQLIFRNLRKKSGVSKIITPHTVRHSFASNFVRNNGNLRHLQALLGHESLDTTQVYTHVEDYELHRAHIEHHTIEEQVLPEFTMEPWYPKTGNYPLTTKLIGV